MLNRLFSAIKRGSKKIGQGGYTLIEVAAVVAITATLSAVVVPIAVDKVKEGKMAAAKQECQSIAAAIAGFNKDTGSYPAYNGAATVTVASLKNLNVLRSGGTSADDGASTVGGAAHDPIGANTMWGANSGSVDKLENHLVKDYPNGTAYNYRTAKVNWNGPYSESFTSKRDPWGNNYLVYVKAMHTPPAAGASQEYGWIISAGPNGILETLTTNNDLQGDDIGVMLFAAGIPKG